MLALLPPILHLRFSLDRFVVSREPRSPVQAVCRCLQALEDGTLETTDLEEDLQALPVLEGGVCRRLLREHLLLPGSATAAGDPSFAALHATLNVLAPQLVSMHRSAYFKVATLRRISAGGAGRLAPPPVRTQLVRCLVRAVLDFTARAVPGARLLQRLELGSGGECEDEGEGGDGGVGAEELAAQYGAMARWSECQPMLVFHSSDQQTLTPLYQDPDKVPVAFVELLRSQAPPDTAVQWSLPQYKDMPRNKLRDILVRVVCFLLS